VHLLHSPHHFQLWNDRGDSPKSSPKLLRISATQTRTNSPVFAGFSSHRTEILAVRDLRGKLMFCH
jgi:hypothetical protein